MVVKFILKEDKRSRVLTEGIVKEILTNAPWHQLSIKVGLEGGQIGRVQEIIED